MISEESRAVIADAGRLYEMEFRKELERDHPGRYACIEPVSGRYFLGDTFDDAVNAALDAYPDRLTHTVRIGHAAALHMGLLGCAAHCS